MPLCSTLATLMIQASSHATKDSLGSPSPHVLIVSQPDLGLNPEVRFLARMNCPNLFCLGGTEVACFIQGFEGVCQRIKALSKAVGPAVIRIVRDWSESGKG